MIIPNCYELKSRCTLVTSLGPVHRRMNISPDFIGILRGRMPICHKLGVSPFNDRHDLLFLLGLSCVIRCCLRYCPSPVGVEARCRQSQLGCTVFMTQNLLLLKSAHSRDCKTFSHKKKEKQSPLDLSVWLLLTQVGIIKPRKRWKKKSLFFLYKNAKAAKMEKISDACHHCHGNFVCQIFPDCYGDNPKFFLQIWQNALKSF